MQEKLFAQVVGLLSVQELMLRKETIIDSTIIAAPSSAKNREKKRDSDMHQTKKGNTWHFGNRAHIGVDRDTGLVHPVEVTGAHVRDVTVVPELLTGEKTDVFGDSGYLGANKRKGAIIRNKHGKAIRYKINRKPSQSKNNTVRSKGQIRCREHEESSVRAKVEHVLGL